VIGRFVHRYLDPEESLGELLFGMIMTLTVTLGIRLLSPHETLSPRDLATALIGCNVAWGIIDASLYLLGSLFVRNRRIHFVRKLHDVPTEAEALRAIGEEFGLEEAHLVQQEDLAAYHRATLDLLKHARIERARLRGKDLASAALIVGLVSIAAVPGAIPLLMVEDRVLALRLANLLQIGLLFAAGYHWARYSGAPPWRTGAAMVGLGVALVAVAIALGG
jgi:hypothetical protein